MPKEPNPDVTSRVWYVDLSTNPPRLHSFSNLDGSPAECQAFQDHFVLLVYQKNYGGTSTERIYFANRYIHLVEVDQWTGSSHEEIAELEAAGVEIDANLNGLWVPEEIFQKAEAMANTDNDLPGFNGPGAYGIEEKNRFDALVRREVDLELGRQPPYLGPNEG